MSFPQDKQPAGVQREEGAALGRHRGSLLSGYLCRRYMGDHHSSRALLSHLPWTIHHLKNINESELSSSSAGGGTHGKQWGGTPAPHTGWAPSGRVSSLGERWVQEMGMEKKVLLVLSPQKSHTSCSESQKGSLVQACVYTQGEMRSRTQTDGNARLRNNLDNSNTSGHAWFGIQGQHLLESLTYPNVFS